jgi:hypothetical protein
MSNPLIHTDQNEKSEKVEFSLPLDRLINRFPNMSKGTLTLALQETVRMLLPSIRIALHCTASSPPNGFTHILFCCYR